MIDDRPKTIHELLQLNTRPRVIAHRGFSGIAPENTMAAFRKAIEIGADMIELDVLFSRDRRIMAIHDDTLDRTARRKGRVYDLNCAELRNLDVGSWHSKEFAGEGIPTLDVVLELVKGKILLNVEIKSEAVGDATGGGISEAVVQLIHGHAMNDFTIISSFDPRALKQAREVDPKIKIAVLYNRDQQRHLTAKQILEQTGADGFNLAKREVTPEIINQCHKLGRPVAVYTVDDPKTMKRLIEMGANAIFTNRPDVMIELTK